MGGIVTECGENIDREQLDTTLDVVHSAGMNQGVELLSRILENINNCQVESTLDDVFSTLQGWTSQ